MRIPPDRPSVGIRADPPRPYSGGPRLVTFSPTRSGPGPWGEDRGSLDGERSALGFDVPFGADLLLAEVSSDFALFGFLFLFQPDTFLRHGALLDDRLLLVEGLLVDALADVGAAHRLAL